jgi:hypothetical protein
MRSGISAAPICGLKRLAAWLLGLSPKSGSPLNFVTLFICDSSESGKSKTYVRKITIRSIYLMFQKIQQVGTGDEIAFRRFITQKIWSLGSVHRTSETSACTLSLLIYDILLYRT